MASLALYLVGQAVPHLTSFEAFDAVTPGANWAAWQMLFISAILLGWHWKRADIDERMIRHRYAVGGVSLAVLVAAYAMADRVLWVFDKVSFGVGRMLVAYAAAALLFVALSSVMQFPVVQKALRPVRMIGQKSLDSNIIQAAVVMTIPRFLPYQRSGLSGQAIAVGTLLIAWAWAEFRTRQKEWNSATLDPVRRTSAALRI